jgi:hypothetical protein
MPRTNQETEMKRLLLIGLLCASGSAFALEGLPAAKVRDLMIDKTIEGYNEVRSTDYTVFFFPEGKIALVTSKGKRFGNWRIADDGHFCTVFPTEPELCTFIIPHGENAFRRVKDDGTPTHTLKKFTKSNINNY